jgi:hypothetical protein
MKTLRSFIQNIFPESFDKPDTGSWKDTPSYRPGPVLIPADLRGKDSPGAWPGAGCIKKRNTE